MKKCLLLAAIALSFSLTASAAWLTATVADPFTGEPLPGALVTVGTRQAVTNMAGQFVIFIDAGTYDIQVVLIGWARFGS